MNVPLPSQAYLRECFDYDPNTGILTWKQRPSSHFASYRNSAAKWNTKHAGATAGWIANSIHGARIEIGLGYQKYKSARIIWKLMTGEEPPTIDHKDNDPMNNRWNNLRAASRAQNRRNMPGKPGRAIPKGVKRNGSSSWMARVKIGGVEHYLGSFLTIKEAKVAYDAACLRLHGEFANLG